MKPSPAQRLLDAAAFSGLWASAVAAALLLASGLVVAPELPPARLARIMALAFAGTLVVYGVDRLRDLRRDRETSPLRSAFVELHRRGVRIGTSAAGAGSLLLAAGLAAQIWLACAAVLALGLLHRRLKHREPWKTVYVAAAWLVVVVGLPALGLGIERVDPADLLGTVAVIAPTIAANLMVSDLRGLAPDRAATQRLARARWLSAAGVGIALLGAPFLRVGPLAAVPAALLATLVRFRPSERYCLLVVDGSLLAGSLAAAALLRLYA